MKIFPFTLLLLLPAIGLAKEPYATIIHSSDDSAAWGSAVVAEGDLKIYFPTSDTEVSIALPSAARKQLVQKCLIAIKSITSESELAPIPKTKGELLRISVTTGSSYLDVECPKTNGAARDIVSIVQKYLNEEKKKANQSPEPTAPSGRGSS